MADEKKDDAEPREAPRKERVLHTRVPAVLEDELKRLATNLKMPVSNVVRAILEDAIEAVEVVGVRAEDELKGFVHKLSEQRAAIREGASNAGRTAARPRDEGPTAGAPANEAPPDTTPPREPRAEAPPEPSALADVIGFDRLTLRRDATCAVCADAIPRGAEAARGIRENGGAPVLVCTRCSLL